MKKRTMSNAEASYYASLRKDTEWRNFIAKVKPIGVVEKTKGAMPKKKVEEA